MATSPTLCSYFFPEKQDFANSVALKLEVSGVQIDLMHLSSFTVQILPRAGVVIEATEEIKISRD